VKRYFFTFIVFFFFLFSTTAESDSKSLFHFSIKPLYSFEYGTLNEFVYSKDSDQNIYKLSELNWTVKNHSIGLSADWGVKWLSFCSSFSYGLNGPSGNMYDSDWQHPSNHSIKTEYSISDNTLNTFSNLELSLLGRIPLTPESISKTFSVTYIPSIKYCNSYYNFSAKDAEGWYGSSIYTNLDYPVPYNSPNAKHFLKGELMGIDYKREHQILFFGEGVKLQFYERLNLFVNFDISIFSIIESVDTHYTNKERTLGTDYRDTMTGYFNIIKVSSAIDYQFNKKLYIGANYIFTYQALTTGNTQSKNHTLDEYYLLKNSFAGSSGMTHNFSIYLKYALDDLYFIY